MHSRLSLGCKILAQSILDEFFDLFWACCWKLGPKLRFDFTDLRNRAIRLLWLTRVTHSWWSSKAYWGNIETIRRRSTNPIHVASVESSHYSLVVLHESLLVHAI